MTVSVRFCGGSFLDNKICVRGNVGCGVLKEISFIPHGKDKFTIRYEWLYSRTSVKCSICQLVMRWRYFMAAKVEIVCSLAFPWWTFSILWLNRLFTTEKNGWWFMKFFHNLENNSCFLFQSFLVSSVGRISSGGGGGCIKSYCTKTFAILHVSAKNLCADALGHAPGSCR